MVQACLCVCAIPTGSTLRVPTHPQWGPSKGHSEEVGGMREREREEKERMKGEDL